MASWQIQLEGAVQGVGFRPFVYGLARALDLTGWVTNSPQGVTIAAEGTPDGLASFLDRLQAEKPPHALIQQLHVQPTAPQGYTDFIIQPSQDSGAKSTLIMPDLAICLDCLAELFDPDDRRYRYPFINCTHCGPRYTLVEALPYDRPNTAMRHFHLCPACQQEYDNPLNRRFHAQPNACPVCGPQLALWTPTGEVIASHEMALQEAAQAIRDGKIVALKGLGGFHLIADARYASSVRRLRQRKMRPHKPFAVMYPSLPQVERDCVVSDLERHLLTSPQAPIVLLLRQPDSNLTTLVAPENPYLGVMLPYTPLHHLLMDALRFPVVATSANLSDEPLCTNEYEALYRLGEVADLFLVHNRPIVNPVDDSIVRVINGTVTILRRARGYAPFPVKLSDPVAEPVLAVGAHQKNTVAFALGDQAFISQHIGDLDQASAQQAFHRITHDLTCLYEIRPQIVVADLHPDYPSRAFAEQVAAETQTDLLGVQHHHAHILAVMAEHQIKAPVLGIAWDGTGYGSDGTIWGGEFLAVDGLYMERVAHLRPFSLPGGNTAIRQPRRSGLGLLYEIFGEAVPLTDAFTPHEYTFLIQMLRQQINAPRTSSMGRLFDGVASLLDVCQVATFEGQAASLLEFAAAEMQKARPYPFAITGDVIDWSPLIRALLDERDHAAAVPWIAARFHASLIEMITAVAEQVRLPDVVLSGGCFQNRRLLEGAIQQLSSLGYRVYWSQQVPANDGGIALGQVLAGQLKLQELRACV